MANSTIEVKNLSKNYGNIKAIKNVSFKASAGEIIAILGPNGAGKSTLMNMLTGYLSPSRGSIYILGKNIAENAMFAKENIGFLPEGAPLYPDMTVEQFLNYMAELRGLEKYQRTETLAALYKIANITEVLTQRIETLSKGYLRRVGFAQSIISNPQILILDEPTDGLDPNQKKHIRALIKEISANKTILISTHLLDEAENLCNKIILFNKGQIVANGSLEDILKICGAKDLKQAFEKLTLGEE